jgi:hypothetical protein
VMTNIVGVYDAVLEALKQTPTPPPPRKGEGH